MGVPIPGDLGVTGFFVLSGFLITRLLLAELDSTGTISFSSFYARRTLRIFPAYYAFVICSLILDTLRGQPWSPLVIFTGFGYGMNYYNAFFDHQGPIAHAWSLAVEEQFYLLWPVAVCLLMRSGRLHAARVLGAVIVLVVMWRSYLYMVLGSGPAYVYNAFETRIDSLAIGCLIALLSDHPGFLSAAGRVATRAWQPLVTLSLILLSRMGGSLPYHYSIGLTVDSFLMGIFILQVLQLHTRRLWSWLEMSAVKFVGKISYPIYLWHLVGAGVGRYTPGPPLVQVLAALTATVLLASCSYFFLEYPFLKLKERFTPCKAGTAAPAGSFLHLSPE
jgi:peptidoglycan/LPS O-acetylase OafA/YrhL